MNTLDKEVNLDGRLETITMTEFHRHPGAVLAQVALGKTYVITRAGREVAVLSRVPGKQLGMDIDGEGKVKHTLES